MYGRCVTAMGCLLAMSSNKSSSRVSVEFGCDGYLTAIVKGWTLDEQELHVQNRKALSTKMYRTSNS